MVVRLACTCSGRRARSDLRRRCGATAASWSGCGSDRRDEHRIVQRSVDALAVRDVVDVVAALKQLHRRGPGPRRRRPAAGCRPLAPVMQNTRTFELRAAPTGGGTPAARRPRTRRCRTRSGPACSGRASSAACWFRARRPLATGSRAASGRIPASSMTPVGRPEASRAAQSGALPAMPSASIARLFT